MRILSFDSVGGASGDMILGALIELGVEPEWLQKELASLPVGEFRIEARHISSHNIEGTQVAVHIPEHHHDGHEHHHEHEDRRLRDIEAIVSGSKLPAAVKESSLKVFRRLAEAEAKIHGTTPDQIHFHEVGAVDSIVDIVGCCLGLDRLRVDAVAVGSLPMGRGTIKCAHGVYPNPAPATSALLTGMAIIQTDEPFELVTPTGAALLSTWKTHDAPPPGSRIARTGYSFGHHRLNERPNLLRSQLLEAGSATSAADTCLVLECNIDDTNPELIGALADRLMQAGALDVFTTAIQMKKQRPGILLTVLGMPEDKDRLLDLIFRETTTFGVREHTAQRTILERRWVDVATPYGSVRIKIGRWRNEDTTFSPEMDDCVRRAQERGVPVRRVYESASQLAQALRQLP